MAKLVNTLFAALFATSALASGSSAPGLGAETLLPYEGNYSLESGIGRSTCMSSFELTVNEMVQVIIIAGFGMPTVYTLKPSRDENTIPAKIVGNTLKTTEEAYFQRRFDFVTTGTEKRVRITTSYPWFLDCQYLMSQSGGG